MRIWITGKSKCIFHVSLESNRYTDLKRMDQSEKIIRGGSVYGIEATYTWCRKLQNPCSPVDVVLKKVKMDATQCVELPTLEEFDIFESTLTTFVDPKQ